MLTIELLSQHVSVQMLIMIMDNLSALNVYLSVLLVLMLLLVPLAQLTEQVLIAIVRMALMNLMEIVLIVYLSVLHVLIQLHAQLVPPIDLGLIVIVMNYITKVQGNV